MGNNLKTSAITTNNTKPAVPVKKVAIIDGFFDKVVCIDNDNIPDASHGEVASRFIKESLPNAKIDCFKLNSKNGVISGKDINAALDNVLAKIDKGEKYDAMNFSLGAKLSYDVLSQVLGRKITPENLSQNKDVIRALLLNVKEDEGVSQLSAEFEKLDKISSKGIPIYVAGADEGNESFNIYSLVKGVKTVGALDKEGKKAKFSADDSTITNWAQGVFDIRLKKNSAGITGFDYTGDGSIDIPASETSSLKKKGYTEGLWGTSFATPKAIVEDLKNKK